MTVGGMPQFSVGDRDVLFVGSRGAVSPLVGLTHGRFRIVRDTQRGADTVRLNDGSPLVSTATLGRRAGAIVRGADSLSLSSFESEIAERMRALGAPPR